MRNNYAVIVGNIGTVYRGPDRWEALENFVAYQRLSQSNSGRAGGEIVTLMDNSDIIEQYVPACCDEEN